VGVQIKEGSYSSVGSVLMAGTVRRERHTLHQLQRAVHMQRGPEDMSESPQWVPPVVGLCRSLAVGLRFPVQLCSVGNFTLAGSDLKVQVFPILEGGGRSDSALEPCQRMSPR
jgi:hypothetical protein